MIAKRPKGDHDKDASNSGRESTDVGSQSSRPPPKKTPKLPERFRLDLDDNREFDEDSTRVSAPSSSQVPVKPVLPP